MRLGSKNPLLIQKRVWETICCQYFVNLSIFIHPGRSRHEIHIQIHLIFDGKYNLHQISFQTSTTPSHKKTKQYFPIPSSSLTDGLDKQVWLVVVVVVDLNYVHVSSSLWRTSTNRKQTGWFSTVHMWWWFL